MDANIARRRQRRAIGAGMAALLLGSAGVAGAESGGGWGSFGVFGGVLQWDPRLADHQWDVSPGSTWGAEALMGQGGWGGGVRVWGAGSRQSIDASSGTEADVRALGGEAVGRRRLAEAWGIELAAVTSVGALRLSYDPEHVSIATGGAPIEVDLEPILAWTGSGGVAIERRLAGPWSTRLEVDHRRFEIETAHQAGGAIVTERQWFGSWSARLELARGWGAR